MDVSGAVKSLNTLGQVGTRTAAELSASESHYNALADSMTRVSLQAELATARMLKAGSAAGTSARSGQAASGGGSFIDRFRANQINESNTAQMARFESRRLQSDMASRPAGGGSALSEQTQLRVQRNLSSYIISQIREQQQAMVAAEELRERVARNMAAQRASVVISQIREQQQAMVEAEELRDRVSSRIRERNAQSVIAQIREQQRVRMEADAAVEEASRRAIEVRNRIIIANRRATSRDTIDEIRDQQDSRVQSRAFRPNANTRNPMQDMEDSIARMRGELNPMVGMQHRLAREAMEFRQQLDLAVISGRMNWQTAQGILNTYEQVSAELQQQAMQQQAGFLGMRRMGFAAQQFGYAIEDAASVYGTMGLAGAFRAAGNNLTVMVCFASAPPPCCPRGLLESAKLTSQSGVARE